MALTDDENRILTDDDVLRGLRDLEHDLSQLAEDQPGSPVSERIAARRPPQVGTHAPHVIGAVTMMVGGALVLATLLTPSSCAPNAPPTSASHR